MARSGFLGFSGFRYLRLSAVLVVASIIAYVWHEPPLGPRGDTWLGYTLGTVGAALILLLILFGMRKRAYRSRLGTVQGWLSAHVYLGLALFIIATLHAAFEFGWNVHTLAYVLMSLVIVSGVWGTVVYARNPTLMGGLLEGKTLLEHGEVLRELDARSRRLAQDMGPEVKMLVEESAAAPIVSGLFARLRGKVRHCPTRRAVIALERYAKGEQREIYAVQYQRLAQLTKIRHFLRLKAWTDVWLMFHVPLSIALLGSLTAHVVAVFFYW
jgi:hypothetical protein